MAARVQFKGVVLDPPKVAELLRGPNGPVMRHAMVVGQQVKRGAQAQVGVKTGNLRSRIVTRIVSALGLGAAVEVGVVGVSYAELHHEGTRPHVIVPRRASVLVFDVGGQTVFSRRVQHPGTKANRFLTDPARRLGLKVRLKSGAF